MYIYIHIYVYIYIFIYIYIYISCIAPHHAFGGAGDRVEIDVEIGIHPSLSI